MKRILKIATFISMLGVLVHLSCQKNFLCPDCDSNKPPIAHAGKDTTIVLPVDSVILDGSASTDDKKIVSYQWTKISGPDTFKIVQPTIARTTVNKLEKGVFEFELKVTDAEGLFSKDTVQVTVNAAISTNHPPVANAGKDTIITLPVTTVMLDGSASTDPDNNIVSYAWTKISGPSSFNIVNVNAVQTQVSNLVEGVYQFELKVTDAGGLFSKDTMRVTLNASTTINNCDISNRPLINAQLIPIGTLSQARAGMAVALANNKIVFAGGGYVTGSPTSARVDIFDISSNSWTTAELSQARWGIATAVLGNKIFFAGGGDGGGTYDNNVDVYDILTNTWTLAHLSEPRSSLTGASVGNKVFFAGGTSNNNNYNANDKVDIYDLSTNIWSTAMLSKGRFDLSAVTIGTKIYFAGGGDIANSRNTIDIYDNATNVWSSSNLQYISGGATGIAVNDNIYWTGFDGQTNVSKVEVKNVPTGATTVHCLSYTRYMPAIALQNNKLIFFTGANIWGEMKNRFDIYDITTNTWSIGVLPVSIEGASIISVNDIIYVAGGIVNGSVSNQVWKLEF